QTGRKMRAGRMAGENDALLFAPGQHLTSEVRNDLGYRPKDLRQARLRCQRIAWNSHADARCDERLSYPGMELPTESTPVATVNEDQRTAREMGSKQTQSLAGMRAVRQIQSARKTRTRLSRPLHPGVEILLDTSYFGARVVFCFPEAARALRSVTGHGLCF